MTNPPEPSSSSHLPQALIGALLAVVAIAYELLRTDISILGFVAKMAVVVAGAAVFVWLLVRKDRSF